ncbi:MAG: hypothetical protein A2Z75_02225 [Chloroflexi bacterium RBG_13_50_10]|nr:MAG: hypothetical protein A2Z75_02225 [Chloroflexi bacterium RBG_13_50_10]
MYCRNCASAVAEQAVSCPKCGTPPLSGKTYCWNCGKSTSQDAQFCRHCGTALTNIQPDMSPKSRLTTTLLAYFLGVFGAHRFYLGKIGTGLAMLFTLGGLGIWALIDFIMAIAGLMKDSQGKPIKNW